MYHVNKLDVLISNCYLIFLSYFVSKKLRIEKILKILIKNSEKTDQNLNHN